jgi:hypothetical protein
MPGLKSVPVTTDATWQRFVNHFVTIEFNEVGGGLRLKVRAWETEPADGIMNTATVADRVLKRMTA